MRRRAAPEAEAEQEAEEEKAPEKKGSPIEITGFVDVYYGYNFNDPGDTQLRTFDIQHNQLSLSLIEVALEQKATSDSRLGFRADLDFGTATDIVHAYEPGGAEIFKNIEQAYVSGLGSRQGCSATSASSSPRSGPR